MADDTANLYGLPGAEFMEDSPETVYECCIEHRYDPDDRTRVVIEEWSALPLRAFMPSADSVIERVLEWTGDEVSGGAWDCMADAQDDPEVVAAFDAALLVLGSKLTGWRQANRKLRELTVTFTDDGKPLLDGEPMYLPTRPIPGQTDIFGGEA